MMKFVMYIVPFFVLFFGGGYPAQGQPSFSGPNNNWIEIKQGLLYGGTLISLIQVEDAIYAARTIPITQQSNVLRIYENNLLKSGLRKITSTTESLKETICGLTFDPYRQRILWVVLEDAFKSPITCWRSQNLDLRSNEHSQVRNTNFRSWLPWEYKIFPLGNKLIFIFDPENMYFRHHSAYVSLDDGKKWAEIDIWNIQHHEQAIFSAVMRGREIYTAHGKEDESVVRVLRGVELDDDAVRQAWAEMDDPFRNTFHIPTHEVLRMPLVLTDMAIDGQGKLLALGVKDKQVLLVPLEGGESIALQTAPLAGPPESSHEVGQWVLNAARFLHVDGKEMYIVLSEKSPNWNYQNREFVHRIIHRTAEGITKEWKVAGLSPYPVGVTKKYIYIRTALSRDGDPKIWAIPRAQCDLGAQ